MYYDYLKRADIQYLTLPVPVEYIAETCLGYTIDFVDDGIFSDPEILGGIDFIENKRKNKNTKIINYKKNILTIIKHFISF